MPTREARRAGHGRRASPRPWCGAAGRGTERRRLRSAVRRRVGRRRPDPSLHRPDTVHFETYNPSLAADQMQDLATVLAWARSQPDVREVSLVGQGLAGSQVLLARPLLEGLARTVVDLSGLPRIATARALPRRDRPARPLQFGGLKAAAALCRPGAALDRPARAVVATPGPRPPTSSRARPTPFASRQARSPPRPSPAGSTGESKQTQPSPGG